MADWPAVPDLAATPQAAPPGLSSSPGPLALPAEAMACLPERLHPASRYFLERWLDGGMTTPEFLRWFHMPNSDYLEAGRCLLTAIAGG